MNRTIRRRPLSRVEVLEGRLLLANAGSLDPSFGGGLGYAAISYETPIAVTSAYLSQGVSLTASSMVMGPGGLIVESGTISFGSSRQLLGVAEFNANGSPVTSFGTSGVVEDVINIEGVTSGQPLATAVQSDGKIIEAEFGTPGFDSRSPLTVVRLNANGSLDPTFGTNGVAIFPSESSASSTGVNPLSAVASIVVQTNGQIVLVGSAESYLDGTETFAAMRLNANGTIDPTYGTNGVTNVLVDVNSGFSGDNAVGAVLQANGQIVVVGTVYVGIDIAIGKFGTAVDDVGAIRLNTDGSLDTSYGGTSAQGKVLLPGDPNDTTIVGQNVAKGLAIQSDGKILISSYYNIVYAGSTQGAPNSGRLLYRLNSDGTLDTNFGADGQVSPLDFGQVVAQADGSIDVAGPSSPANSYLSPGPSYVAQLTATGTPDTSFGINGVVQIPSPVLLPSPSATVDSALPYLLAIQPTSGDILVGGIGTVSTPGGRVYSFDVAALLPSATTNPAAPPIETVPASFDGSGQTDLAVYDPAHGTLYYRPAGTTGSQDVGVAFGSAGVGQSIPAAADYQGTGKTQVAVYLPAFGDYAIQPTATSPGLLMQFGMAGAGQTIPVPADYEGTGKADVAVYMPSIAAFAIIPSNGTAAKLVPFGIAGVGQSIPAPADYYNTGQADIAVYLSALGAFAIQDPTGKTTGEVIPFGMPGVGNSIPVPGDYDGSGKTELAVYIPSLEEYIYRPANGGKDVAVPIGTATSGEIPVPGDYDGSGRTEVAIYNPTGGFFEYKPAFGNSVVTYSFGAPNNGSLPAAASAGSLPEFTSAGLVSSMAFRPNGAAIFLASSGSTASSSTSSVVVTPAVAVPRGPNPGSIRVALSLVNQGSPDSSKIPS